MMLYYSYVKKHEFKCTLLRSCPLKHRSDCVYLSDESGKKVLSPGPYVMFFSEMKEYGFSIFILLSYITS